MHAHDQAIEDFQALKPQLFTSLCGLIFVNSILSISLSRNPFSSFGFVGMMLRRRQNHFSISLAME